MTNQQNTPPKNNTQVFEAFTPFQLHSQLEEVKHLLNAAYFTLESANGNRTRLDAGIYTVASVASKLEDLVFHYENVMEQQAAMPTDGGAA